MTRYLKLKNYQTIVKHGLIYSFGYIMSPRGKVIRTYGHFVGTTFDEYVGIPF